MVINFMVYTGGRRISALKDMPLRPAPDSRAVSVVKYAPGAGPCLSPHASLTPHWAVPWECSTALLRRIREYVAY